LQRQSVKPPVGATSRQRSRARRCERVSGRELHAPGGHELRQVPPR
jgi:hypothetical protein